MVTLGADGTTSSYDTVPEVSKHQHDHLEGTIHAESSTLTYPENNENAKVQMEQTTLNLTPDGTLIPEEEVGVGHVSWSARELMLLSLTIISISFTDRSSAVRLYFSSLGEQWNILFWPAFFIVMPVKHFAATAETWSLGYWSQQYETQPASEVNVPRYVVFCLH